VKSAVPSPNRIILLRHADGDGVAEIRTVFAQGLESPFGMTLVDGTLYANADGVVSFPWRPGQSELAGTASFSRLPTCPNGVRGD
jgi:glucose/arabinose dehydrogenase